MKTHVRQHMRRLPHSASVTTVTDHDRQFRSTHGHAGPTVVRAPQAQEYNGHYNYNVWNVSLWLDNDEGLNKEKEQLFDDRDSGRITENEYWVRLNRLGARAKNISDVKNKRLSNDEINALRQELDGEYHEYAEYKRKSSEPGYKEAQEAKIKKYFEQKENPAPIPSREKVYDLSSEKGFREAENRKSYLNEHYNEVKVEKKGIDKVSLQGVGKYR